MSTHTILLLYHAVSCSGITVVSFHDSSTNKSGCQRPHALGLRMVTVHRSCHHTPMKNNRTNSWQWKVRLEPANLILDSPEICRYKASSYSKCRIMPVKCALQKQGLNHPSTCVCKVFLKLMEHCLICHNI